MKLFVSLSKSGVFYRGIEGVYDKGIGKKQRLVWVTQDPEYAELYGDVAKFKVKVKNSFNFGFRTTMTHVKYDDLLSRIQEDLMELFRNKKLPEQKARSVLKDLQELRKQAKANTSMKQVWEWWMAGDKMLDVLEDMGYDSITTFEGANDDIQTYGLFYPGMLREI